MFTWRKKGCLLFALFLVMLLPVQGLETFNAIVTPLQNIIIVNETASFDVLVINSFDTEKEFRIEKAGYPFWDMFVKPLQNPITLTVPPESNETIRLFIRPLHVSVVDTYNVDTDLVDIETDVKRRIPLRVSIKSTDPLIDGYVPTVLATASMPTSIDPREDFALDVTLNNQNPLDHPELTVVVSSELINEQHTYALGPLEEKTFTIPLNLYEMTPPQDDEISITVLRDDKVIAGPITQEFSIKRYSFKEETMEPIDLLKSRHTIAVFSNDPTYEETIRTETTFVKSLFTSTYPDAVRIIENDQRYLEWNVNLGGSNKASVEVTQNYRPLVIIIIILLILIALYYILRSPLILTKDVSSVVRKEGGVTEIKVLLRLKNRGKVPLEDIEVGDVIPRIAVFSKEPSLGSVEPKKVTHSRNRGTILKWDIEKLEAGEGVLLTYRMNSKLAILGEFNLPSATARMKKKNNYIVTYSNRATVNQ